MELETGSSFQEVTKTILQTDRQRRQTDTSRHISAVLSLSKVVSGEWPLSGPDCFKCEPTYTRPPVLHCPHDPCSPCQDSNVDSNGLYDPDEGGSRTSKFIFRPPHCHPQHPFVEARLWKRGGGIGKSSTQAVRCSAPIQHQECIQSACAWQAWPSELQPTPEPTHRV